MKAVRLSGLHVSRMSATSCNWQGLALCLIASLLLLLLSFTLIYSRMAKIRSSRSALLETLANVSRGLDRLHVGLEDIAERATRARMGLARLSLNCGATSLVLRSRLDGENRERSAADVETR